MVGFWIIVSCLPYTSVTRLKVSAITGAGRESGRVGWREHGRPRGCGWISADPFGLGLGLSVWSAIKFVQFNKTTCSIYKAQTNPNPTPNKNYLNKRKRAPQFGASHIHSGSSKGLEQLGQIGLLRGMLLLCLLKFLVPFTWSKKTPSRILKPANPYNHFMFLQNLLEQHLASNNRNKKTKRQTYKTVSQVTCLLTYEPLI